MRKNKAFTILSDNNKFTLFDAYYAVYEKEIKTFENAKLVFDREPIIESKVLNSAGSYENVVFKDSQEDRMLQFSDAIVGFASKLNTYVENNEVEALVHDVMEMNELQRKNLFMWFDIEDKSSDFCPFLFHHMQSFSTRKKMAILENGVKNI
jgi:hypothetical protein